MSNPSAWAAPISLSESLARRIKFSRIINLLSPDHHLASVDTPNALRLSFNDIDAPMVGLVAPSTEDIAQLLRFSRDWDGRDYLGVFCYAGVSRSSAAAYIIACDRNDGAEQEIADGLRTRAPFVTPNALMIAIADSLLGRKGRMIEAIRNIGRGADVHTGLAYQLPLRWTVS